VGEGDAAQSAVDRRDAQPVCEGADVAQDGFDSGGERASMVRIAPGGEEAPIARISLAGVAA